MDLNRLPSGKFATNHLVCSLAALAMNLLRIVGQYTLHESDSSMRKQDRTAPAHQDRDARVDVQGRARHQPCPGLGIGPLGLGLGFCGVFGKMKAA